MDKQKLHKENTFSISSDELKSKLDNQIPLMLFDIRDAKSFGQRHIPRSAYAVCNEESKKNIMPLLPKDIEIVLVGEGEEYPKQISEMMRQFGLDAKYLEGGISSWKWQFNESSDKDISPKELKTLLDSPKDKDNIFLLDVREPDEFRQWNIDGSINIPLGNLFQEQSLARLPKDKRVVTICPQGNRATVGKYILERYGYNASSLSGGLKAWSTSFEYAYSVVDIDGSKIRLVQFRRIGKGCMSYLLDSEGESVVIDPVYPIDDYLQKASEIGTKISRVVETHQHADHISSAKELAKKTGAIYYQSRYENYINEGIEKRMQIRDADIIDVGRIKIKTIHTPGHTLGSLSFLVNGRNGDNNSELLFTGDTLFVNGIGRPDLRDRSKEFATMLYDTLHNKLFSLCENSIVFPAHFDKDEKAEKIISSTLGEIRKKSDLIKLKKDDFVNKVSSTVMPMPPSYKEIIAINTGKKTVPTVNEIYDLEIGPNRCSISM